MSTDPVDTAASTSDPRPPTPEASTSELASPGGAPPHSSDNPSAARHPSLEPPNAVLGPYTTASARTSYTRVDVDSLPAPVYPPLPPLPTALVVQDVPVLATAAPGGTTPPAMTTVTTTAATQPPDAQALSTEPPIPQTPQVSLTFLLVSGLRKTQSFDPETTVGRVKELVWNAWPTRDADWQDERPPAPSYLRILYLGKILQDDDTLLRVGFPTTLASASSITPTIVHLSIRPYALPSDDPTLSKKRRLSVAISRRLSSAGVGGGEVEHTSDGEAARTGCCTGCTIC